MYPILRAIYWPFSKPKCFKHFLTFYPRQCLINFFFACRHALAVGHFLGMIISFHKTVTGRRWPIARKTFAGRSILVDRHVCFKQARSCHLWLLRLVQTAAVRVCLRKTHASDADVCRKLENFLTEIKQDENGQNMFHRKLACSLNCTFSMKQL